jgi:hypothetical protein
LLVCSSSRCAKAFGPLLSSLAGTNDEPPPELHKFSKDRRGERR